MFTTIWAIDVYDLSYLTIYFYWVSRPSANAPSSGQKITMVSKQTKVANENDIKLSKMQYTDKRWVHQSQQRRIGWGLAFQFLFCYPATPELKYFNVLSLFGQIACKHFDTWQMM